MTITIDEIRPPAPCAECGRNVDPNAISTLHEVTGWTQKRSGGGVNAIRFKYETGRFMCERCARVRRDTGIAQQGRML